LVKGIEVPSFIKQNNILKANPTLTIFAVIVLKFLCLYYGVYESRWNGV